MASTGLTRARRSQAALALDPIPASKVHSAPPAFAEFDKHNYVSHSGNLGISPSPSLNLHTGLDLHRQGCDGAPTCAILTASDPMPKTPNKKVKGAAIGIFKGDRTCLTQGFVGQVATISDSASFFLLARRLLLVSRGLDPVLGFLDRRRSARRQPNKHLSDLLYARVG